MSKGGNGTYSSAIATILISFSQLGASLISRIYIRLDTLRAVVLSR
jgi:hypothetical protein